MRFFQFQFTQKNYILLAIIVVCAVFLAIFSYEYSVSSANQILEIASEDIRSNAKIQAYYISLILSNGLKSIATNLQLLSTSHGVQHYDIGSSSILFDAMQQSTNELPDSYLWIDKNGKLMWLSGGGATNQSVLFGSQKGLDLSYVKYFTVPRETHAVYYSEGIVAGPKDNTDVRMYISYPIIDRGINTANKNNNTLGIFKGVVVAIIRFDLGTSILKRQSSAEVEKNSAILVDNSGTILSSYNKAIIGKNIFEYGSQIGAGQMKDTLNSFFRHSLAANSDSMDIELNGKKSSIASQPVFRDGKRLWTVYIIAPHDLTKSVDILFSQQRQFSTLMIIIIGIVAFGVALIVISWNKGLEDIINSRTAELKKANIYLSATNEQLKIHDKMQKEFINIASHEMKTPTQSILLHSSLLYAQPEIREEAIETIRRSATRLQRLTSDILDVTRIESQTLKLNKERFNLKDVITDVLEEYESEIDNGKVQLVYDDPKDILIVADRSRITQVISNLLSNAIKFTKEGFIHVNAEESRRSDHQDNNNSSNGTSSSRFVIISVKDTGPGIDPSILSRLFTKFTTKSDDMGLGLGLYISKKIVEAHGGKIWAENNNINEEGEEKGATFSFSLYINEQSSY
jgi:signal transduction histidine kinase